MNNGIKTLENAQPGGRVRLGDQAELDRLEFQAWARSIGACVEADEHGNYVDSHLNSAKLGWNAALSAQPSPGETLPPDMRLGSADYLDYLDSKPSPGGQDAAIEAMAESLLCAESSATLEDAREQARLLLADALPHLAARQPVCDQHPDDLAVDAFAAAMKAKMAAARAKGSGGWQDPAQCTADDLTRMLRDHVEKGDPRDVANFCMMLHQRGESIAARQPVGEKPERRAPVQGYHGETIPWRVHGLAWEAYAKKYGKQQSAERIAERGGFGCEEMDMFVPGWREMVEGSPAPAVDLDAVRALLQRRIEQWRSHLPADPGAPGTREIETKGEHDYNNDVRIYREGIAVMEEVLALIDGKAAGK